MYKFEQKNIVKWEYCIDSISIKIVDNEKLFLRDI